MYLTFYIKHRCILAIKYKLTVRKYRLYLENSTDLKFVLVETLIVNESLHCIITNLLLLLVSPCGLLHLKKIRRCKQSAELLALYTKNVFYKI